MREGRRVAKGCRWVANTLMVAAMGAGAACSGSTTTLGGSADAGDSGASSGGGSGGSASGSGGGSGGASSGGGSNGSSGSGSSGSGSGTTVDQACTDLATSLCNKIQACAPFLVSLVWGDIATCLARETLACPALFNAPGTGITVSGAEACAPAFMAASCEDTVSNKTPSACAYHGSVATGAPCVENAQCTDSDYCNLALGQGCGACTARAPAGGTCGDDGNCQSGFVCAKQNNATTGSCTQPRGQGAACDPSHPCLATLGCTKAGVCDAPLGAGAPCAAQSCDSLQGLYCNPKTNICARIQPASAGNPCGYSMTDGSYAACVASGRCALATGSTTNGTCEATAAEGQACDPARGPPCLPPAYCAAGTCTLPSANCR